VETSMRCVGVSKETVVNLEVSWYNLYLYATSLCSFSYYSDEGLTSEMSVTCPSPHGVSTYF